MSPGRTTPPPRVAGMPLSCGACGPDRYCDACLLAHARYVRAAARRNGDLTPAVDRGTTPPEETGVVTPADRPVRALHPPPEAPPNQFFPENRSRRDGDDETHADAKALGFVVGFVLGTLAMLACWWAFGGPGGGP